MCDVTDRVILSSTPHDFTESTHVNVRPAADWAASFARRQFFRRADLDLTFITPWAMLMERRTLTPADVAHLYETELAPLREQLFVKQRALLETQRRLDDAVRGRPLFEPVTAERFLEMTDRILGLEAELAQTRYRSNMEAQALADQLQTNTNALVSSELEQTRLREAALHQQIAELYTSRTWRVGRLVIRPFGRLKRAWGGRRV
jgi:hypothetical protein